MTITAEDLVNREVLACVSHLVSTLASCPDDRPRLRTAAGNDLADLCWQAIELACPIDDWQEAAEQAGWAVAQSGPYFVNDMGEFARDHIGTIDPTADDAWRVLCENEDIEPYQLEVFEHWAVSSWLADKLEAHGEKVDRDFAGLCVWARTTTGQAIAMDSVIQTIHAELVSGA